VQGGEVVEHQLEAAVTGPAQVAVLGSSWPAAAAVAAGTVGPVAVGGAAASGAGSQLVGHDHSSLMLPRVLVPRASLEAVD
jgi:hypothetical protein